MDFIQSAIERAREERRNRNEGQGTAAPASPAVAETSPAAATADDLDTREALWTALPVFRPSSSHLARNLIEAARGAPEAIHFDMIRTRLLHQMRAQGWRRVAITSPGSACGKSTVALNLAFSLSRQPELKSLLVELDLRRPSLSRTLGLREPRQFARVLSGQDPAEDHLMRIGGNFALALNATPVPHPAELLQAVAAGRAMDAVEARYAPDIVVFDMPPMLTADDTLAFIDQIDCVLLIAAAEHSSMDEIERCGAELAARCNFLGVVLNKCRYLEEGESYGYGY